MLNMGMYRMRLARCRTKVNLVEQILKVTINLNSNRACNIHTLVVVFVKVIAVRTARADFFLPRNISMYPHPDPEVQRPLGNTFRARHAMQIAPDCRDNVVQKLQCSVARV